MDEEDRPFEPATFGQAPKATKLSTTEVNPIYLQATLPHNTTEAAPGETQLELQPRSTPIVPPLQLPSEQSTGKQPKLQVSSCERSYEFLCIACVLTVSACGWGGRTMPQIRPKRLPDLTWKM